jgi:hypothetical protein
MKSFKEEMINDFIEEIGITENTNAMLKICDACNISRYAYEEVPHSKEYFNFKKDN